MQIHIFMVLILSLVAGTGLGADKLVILSSQRKDMQTEFVSRFQSLYEKKIGKTIDIDWIDVGGAFESVKFLKSRFNQEKKTADIDIIWGGGREIFDELDRSNLLGVYEPPKNQKNEIPLNIGGIKLFSDKGTWAATAMTTFGVFFHESYFKQHHIPTPEHWMDLIQKPYADLLVLPDPRRSTGFSSLLWSMTETIGWDKAWPFFFQLAANVRRFTNNSLEPIKAIEAGDAFGTLTLDFFAFSAMNGGSHPGLKFLLTQDKTVVDVDPVAIVVGAPHHEQAQQFMTFLLSIEGQKLFALAQGSSSGPKNATFGRISINPKLYDDKSLQRVNPFNPFEAKEFISLASSESSLVKSVFTDLWGAMIVDQHQKIRQTYGGQVGAKRLPVREKAPFSRADLLTWAERWHDASFRQRKINEWQTWSVQQLNK